MSYITTTLYVNIIVSYDNIAYGSVQGKGGAGGGAGVSAGEFQMNNGADFACPLTGLPMNGRYRFSALRASGLVVSEKALKEVLPPPALTFRLSKSVRVSGPPMNGRCRLRPPRVRPSCRREGADGGAALACSPRLGLSGFQGFRAAHEWALRLSALRASGLVVSEKALKEVPPPTCC